MSLEAHRDAILSLDPAEQPPEILDAFGRLVDGLVHLAAEKGREATHTEAMAMHHASIARLRSEIGAAGVCTMLEKAVALNEELDARRIGTRAGR